MLYTGNMDECAVRCTGSEHSPASPQLVMNVPFTAIYFTTYESAKKLLNQANDREEGLLTQLTAGGAAGALVPLTPRHGHLPAIA